MNQPFNLTYDAAISATLETINVMIQDLEKQRNEWAEQFPKSKELYDTLPAAYDEGPDTPVTVTAETLRYYAATRSVQGGIMELEGLATAISMASAIANLVNKGEGDEVLGQLGLSIDKSDAGVPRLLVN